MPADHRRLVQRLGYAGLMPFVAGCALIWLIGGRDLDQHAFVSLALSAYAGLVVALLGGVHWGLSLARGLPARAPLLWGPAAVLLGWLGVMMSSYAGLALHGAALIACYMMDRRVYPLLGAADWLTLRFRLTVVASLSCFLAAAGS